VVVIVRVVMISGSDFFRGILVGRVSLGAIESLRRRGLTADPDFFEGTVGALLGGAF